MRTANGETRPVSRFLIFGLLFLTVLFVYYPALDGGFTADSFHIIVNNPHIKQPALYPRIFTSDFFVFFPGPEAVKLNYYRPLVMASYILDYRLGGLNPAVYRLTNILLHAFNAFLLYTLMFRLFSRRKTALLTAVFFCVLPVHEWNILAVSGRTTLLQTLFGLLACLRLLRYWRGAGKPARYLSCLYFFCALLCREAALVFLALFFLTGYAQRVSPGNILRTLFPHAVIGLVYFAARQVWMPILSSLRAAGLLVSWQRLTEWAGIAGEYTLHVVLPRSPALFRWIAFESPFAQVLGLGVLTAAGARLLTGRVRRSHPATFALLWYAAGWIPAYPALAQFRFLGPLFSENYLYLPAMGFALLLALGVTRLRGGWRFLLILLAVFCFCARVALNNVFWTGEYALMKRVRSLEGPRGYMAKEQIMIKYETDPREVERRIDNSPAPEDRSGWLYVLGRYYVQNREYARALEIFRQAREAFPASRVERKIGLVHEKMGRPREALDAYTDALRVDARGYLACRDIGRLFYHEGFYSRAVPWLERAVFYNPDDVRSRLYLGMSHLWTNRTGAFEREVRRALRKSARKAEVCMFVAGELYRHRQAGLAVSFLEDVIRRFPAEPDPKIDLGKIYFNHGRPRKARELWTDVLRREPFNTEARRCLRIYAQKGRPGRPL